MRLAPLHIHGDIIEIKALKTGVMCCIPFYDDDIFKPVQLARKYEGKQKTCLPVNVQINRYLKDIQRLIKFERFPLVTKNRQKNFVTLKLYQGLPARIIMQATGQRTESSFNYYAGISTKKLVTNFQKHSNGGQTGVQI
ncbi:site-specific integrase [Rufibacter latericius]|uniref:Tyr recombinase domain-containing protein n=1 Tax=Rufibacter latericius TaxID=2487040 RepID=A0A3M9M8Y8_9BACT|nr:hypothetical protein [Rufibacter latericius]RNI22021.1 hypothetical protein EFB08_23090 [Rufibacter latericius]